MQLSCKKFFKISKIAFYGLKRNEFEKISEICSFSAHVFPRHRVSGRNTLDAHHSSRVIINELSFLWILKLTLCYQLCRVCFFDSHLLCRVGIVMGGIFVRLIFKEACLLVSHRNVWIMECSNKCGNSYFCRNIKKWNSLSAYFPGLPNGTFQLKREGTVCLIWGHVGVCVECCLISLYLLT